MPTKKVLYSLLALTLVTAAPTFANAEVITWNPGGTTPPLGQPGIGGTGNAFSFNSLSVADFATMTLSGAGTFNETGYLNVTGAVLGSTPFTPIGLGGTTAGGGETSGLYTLYYAFSATGTTSAPNFNSLGVYNGNFSTLNYTLYGVNGESSFSFAGTTPTVTNSSTAVVLGTGSLILGSPAQNVNGLTVTNGQTPSNGSMYEITPSASNLDLTFTPNTFEAGFFSNPNAATSLILNGALTADPGVVTLVNTSTIEINNGRGTLSYSAVVPPPTATTPEPASFALVLSGVAGVAGAVRRRRSARS